MEAGALSVDLCLRRRDIPRINPYRWMESAGFLGHCAEMPDLMRWRFMRHIFELNQPPPQDTFWRCRKRANFAYHTGCPWTSVEMQGDEIVVGTPLGDMRFHFLIVGTGFAIDLRLRPELAAIADKIAIWADRFIPPAGEESALLSSYPYLATPSNSPSELRVRRPISRTSTTSPLARRRAWACRAPRSAV